MANVASKVKTQDVEKKSTKKTIVEEQTKRTVKTKTTTPSKAVKTTKDSNIDPSKTLIAKTKSARNKIVNVTEAELMPYAEKKSNQDVAFHDEYMHMFKSLQKNIRALEKDLKYSRSTRNIYALIGLYNEQREVIADIRAVSDYTENINRIMVSVIQPLFSSVTQSNLDIFYHIRKLVIETAKDDQTQYALKRLEDLMREQARYLQDRYEHTNTQLVKIVTDGK
jgi:hypothetical protein